MSSCILPDASYVRMDTLPVETVTQILDELEVFVTPQISTLFLSHDYCDGLVQTTESWRDLLAVRQVCRAFRTLTLAHFGRLVGTRTFSLDSADLRHLGQLSKCAEIEPYISKLTLGASRLSVHAHEHVSGIFGSVIDSIPGFDLSGFVELNRLCTANKRKQNRSDIGIESLRKALARLKHVTEIALSPFINLSIQQAVVSTDLRLRPSTLVDVETLHEELYNCLRMGNASCAGLQRLDLPSCPCYFFMRPKENPWGSVRTLNPFLNPSTWIHPFEPTLCHLSKNEGTTSSIPDWPNLTNLALSFHSKRYDVTDNATPFEMLLPYLKLLMQPCSMPRLTTFTVRDLEGSADSVDDMLKDVSTTLSTLRLHCVRLLYDGNVHPRPWSHLSQLLTKRQLSHVEVFNPSVDIGVQEITWIEEEDDDFATMGSVVKVSYDEGDENYNIDQKRTIYDALYTFLRVLTE